MRTIRFFVVLLAAFGLGLASQIVSAQTGNLARLYFVDVKSGHEAEFEAALKKHVQWRKQAGDPWTWYVSQVVNGKNLGDFVIRSGGHTWADFDSYSEFLLKGSIEFNKTVGPHIESISSLITAVDTNNINWYPEPDEVNLLRVITYHLKPGQGKAFRDVANKMGAAIREHKREAYFAHAWSVNGSYGPAVSLILPYKNWAGMQGPEESFGDFLARVMGSEEVEKLFEKMSSTYRSRTSRILQVRRDLSVLPGR
jgi:hypothetical protein